MRNDFIVKTIPTEYPVDKWHGYLYILSVGILRLGLIIYYYREMDERKGSHLSHLVN